MQQTIKLLDAIQYNQKPKKQFEESAQMKDNNKGRGKSQDKSKVNDRHKSRGMNAGMIQTDEKEKGAQNYADKQRKSKTYSLAFSRKNKMPFAKLLDFHDKKFDSFPHWLTERSQFFQFMYNNYESKLLMIPKICEQDDRASDQKYFLSLYLEQISMFKGIPQYLMELILNNIKTKYYHTHDIIHEEEDDIQFMAVVFIGSVQFINEGKTDDEGSVFVTASNKNDVNDFSRGNRVVKHRNDVILTGAFYGKKHPTIVAKQQTVLLTLDKSLYLTIQRKIMEDIQEKSRDEIADLLKSDFFIELHLKDKKARSFFQLMHPEFYFKGEHICDAGEHAKKFFLHFRGEIKEKNHIYVREYNKWPVLARKWEVRAVYNSFQNSNIMSQYSFFCDEEIINLMRVKSTYIAKTHLILFSMDQELFLNSLSTEDFKRLKKYRNEHVNINYSDFERDVRDKVKSLHDKKRIVHKAIDTSFANKSTSRSKRVDLIENFEKQMLTHSIRETLRDVNEG